MPAFFDPEFWNLANPELWVGVGLIAFLAIVVFAGAHRAAFSALDARSKAIQDNLDEAQRLRHEAEAMLADIRRQREEAAVRGAQMLREAEEDAARLEAEAKARLEAQIKRRSELADRRIALAEQQAAQDVKAAAAELAARAAEAVLADRLAAQKGDRALDGAIQQIAARLQ